MRCIKWKSRTKILENPETYAVATFDDLGRESLPFYFWISNILYKHQVSRFFHPIYNYSLQETEKQTYKYYTEFLIFKNGIYRRNKYLVLGHEEAYFVKEHSDSKSKYSEDDIIKMLQFLADSIFMFYFCGKGFPAESWHAHGNKLSPSSSRSFSTRLLERSEIKKDTSTKMYTPFYIGLN